jgi:hypothetical protein
MDDRNQILRHTRRRQRQTVIEHRLYVLSLATDFRLIFSVFSLFRLIGRSPDYAHACMQALNHTDRENVQALLVEKKETPPVKTAPKAKGKAGKKK